MFFKKQMRKQIFVDSKVQGGLVWRVTLYWAVFMANVFMMLLCWSMVSMPDRMFRTHFVDVWSLFGPAFLLSLLLLPLVLYDVVAFSNRFAGPMLRMRRMMRELAQGNRIEPISLRENDFWHDFAEDFNAAAARLQSPSLENSPEPQPEPVAAGSET